MHYYSHNSILNWGLYSGKQIKHIPAAWLLQMHAYGNANDHKTKLLIDYVELNLKKIQARNQNETEQSIKPPVICVKKAYPTKAEARYELKRISNTVQSHKKPIRCYECEHCGAWHHTSKPYSKYKPGT